MSSAVPTLFAVDSSPPPRGSLAPAPVLPRVALGDESAVRECLSRYGGLVHSIVCRQLRDAHDIEDACQDIFVALWRSAPSFDARRAGESTFVALVARRRLVDRRRAIATRPLPEAQPEPEPVRSQVEAYVDARNAAAALDDCNDEQRRVIFLAAVQGMTHDEIATHLSMPLGTVKSHYARGIERVKRALRSTKETR